MTYVWMRMKCKRAYRHIASYVCGSASDVIIPPHSTPPHPPTQCYFHSRMQKMTTVASLPDARHQKHAPPQKRCLTTPCPAHPCTISRPDGAISQRSVFSQALVAALKVISSAWTECLGVPKTFNKHIAYCGLLWHRLKPLV